MKRHPELTQDANAYYQWAERTLDNGKPYGIRYHLFEFDAALAKLNAAIREEAAKLTEDELLQSHTP